MAKIPREITVGIEVRGLEKMRDAIYQLGVASALTAAQVCELGQSFNFGDKYNLESDPYCIVCGAELSDYDLKRCICSSCGADWGRVECPWCGRHWAENPGVCWDGVNGCGGPIPIGVKRGSPWLIDNFGLYIDLTQPGDVVCVDAAMSGTYF